MQFSCNKAAWKMFSELSPTHLQKEGTAVADVCHSYPLVGCDDSI